MSVDRSLLDQLIAEPTDDRFLIYADQLQTHGDPRGELIVLDVHARTTNAPRDQRATDIERDLSAQLTAMLDTSDGVRLTWERGFVFEAILSSALVPKIIERGWLEHEALANLKSIGIYDRSSRIEDTQPIDLLVRSSTAQTLERVAIGSAQHGLVAAEKLVALFDGLPKLTMLELRAVGMLHEERILALERFERLESLALWTPGNDVSLRRLVEAPWPHLKALAFSGRGTPPGRRELPEEILPLLDGSRHPLLDQLVIFNCGYEMELLTQLPNRPLGKRLRALGLNWRMVEDDTLEAVRDAFENIELIWPRPVGDKATADDEYQMARRLRLGMDRDRKALPHAVRACELEPTSYFHWTEVGYVHGALDQLPEKLAAMDRAIEINRERWGGWAGRGSALRELKRYDEAREAYETGLSLDPSRVSLHHGLGEVHECTGKLADAVECFERASQHSTTDDNRAFYLGNVATVLIEHGELLEAASHLRRARELAPRDVRIARLTGYERLWSNEPGEALAIATELSGRAGDEDELFTHALRAAALRGLGDQAVAPRYQLIVDECDCPAWISLAWLGITLAGGDPFAAVSSVIDPLALADALGVQVNATRETPRVHDTADRCNDRITTAVAAIAAATITSRADEARSRAAALADYIAGPAPVKRVFWWIELAELLRAAAGRAPGLAELITTSYQLATGRR